MKNPREKNILWEQMAFFLNNRFMVLMTSSKLSFHKYGAQEQVTKCVFKLSFYDLDEPSISSFFKKKCDLLH